MRRLILIPGALVLFACSTSPRFRLMDPKQTGIDFENRITENDSLNVVTYEYTYNGAGTGTGDLNNDGLEDIVFAGNQVSSRIYLNEGNFRFRDISTNFKGLTNDQWFSGVALIDINNDGWLDVYLTSTENRSPGKCKNRLWINNGAVDGNDPSFTEMAEKYGIDNEDQSVSAAFFDYDLDGFPDLYILNNVVNEKIPSAYRPKITDGSALNNDRLYHNNGNGTFSDVTREAGIVYEGYGMGLAISDLNKDGYPDIYISNDLISNDVLYINQRNGTFRNEIRNYISFQSRTSKGNDIADINNDGNPDIFTLDVLPESYWKRKQTINGFAYSYYQNDEKYGFEHQYLRNMIHIHNGFLSSEMLPFSETGQNEGISQSGWSWSALFADYDNDGDKDLMITTGFPRDITDKDWTKLKVRAQGFYATDLTLAGMAPELKIPNVAFENTGDRFVKRSDWLPGVNSFSYGAVTADLDNDGDLDYVVNNINDKAFILRNMTIERDHKNSNYLKIRLTGKGGNKMALGAKTEIWSGGKYQYDEHFLSRGYASSVDPVIHFGLSGEASVDSLKITWPASQNSTILKNIKANQLIELNEADSEAAPPAHKTSKTVGLLFERRDDLLDYAHEQSDFSDYASGQGIIPHKFSQIGPRMAKGDINGDHLEDLIIGSTNTLPTKVFIRSDKGFEEGFFDGLTTRKVYSEGDLAIADIDSDGDNDVVAVAGGYENNNENEYAHYWYENRDGKFISHLLPIPQFPSSVVRLCDYDHDGSVDIFIGARVKRGMFPYSNHSWLIKNDKGKLTTDAGCRINLGLVTDALWTDYDNDGWEDLLVAREYNSLAVLKNMQGKELVPQLIPEVESKQGIWFSLASGDLDNDGDIDYIAGNLGENNSFRASDKYPMNLYAIDLENNHSIVPILTSYWPDREGKMTEYPVNYLDELVNQSSFFESKFRDYVPFSYAGIGEILDKNTMKRLEFKLQATTTSSYVIWNDKGKFTWERLPQVVQYSPVKKMIVEDLNNDSYPDVLIGGNDYTYEPGTGNYDANKGIVLLNRVHARKKNQLAFNVLGSSESGLLLQGMLESLIWMKGDTSLVIAGFNRGKAVVYEHHPKPPSF